MVRWSAVAAFSAAFFTAGSTRVRNRGAARHRLIPTVCAVCK